MKQLIVFSIFMAGLPHTLTAGDSKAPTLPISIQLPANIIVKTSKTMADLSLGEIIKGGFKGGLMTLIAATFVYVAKSKLFPNASASDFQQSTIITRNKSLLSDGEFLRNKLQSESTLLVSYQQLLCAQEQHAKSEEEKKRCAILRKQGLDMLEAYTAKLASVLG